ITATPRAPRALAFNETSTVPGVPFTRLLAVEARKLVNTRAGRWVIALSLLGSVLAVAGAMALIDNPTGHALFDFAIAPVGLMMPVVTILAATAEWSQRTGLITFALEPRRGRVVGAKLVVAMLLGALTVVVGIALAGAAYGIALATGSAAGWELTWQVVAGNSVVMLAGMLQAAAFAFALLNTPAAIVAYFLVPTVVSIATSLSGWLAERAAWVDVSSAGIPFSLGQFSTSGWAHLATASAIWILIPLVAGVARVLRSEIK
uniref:ABC transporter permease n=1 Tax=Luteococcus sp. TaxID=1969402 RepID=UPI0037360C90